MFTWISETGFPGRVRRPGLAFGLVLGLGGCLSENASRGADPLDRAELAGGQVVVVGPPGYCVDRGSLDARPSGGFALIGACAALGGAGPGEEPVVMTVQVQRRPSRQEPPDAQALAAAVAPLRVLAREDRDDISLIQLAEGGDTALPGSDPRHWRGAMMINGHAVALSLYAPEGSSATGRGGRARLIALSEAILEASPTKDDPEEMTAAQAAAARNEDAQAAGDSQGRGGLRGMFPGLFQ